MTRLLLWLLAGAVVIGVAWTFAANRVPALGLLSVIAEGTVLSAWDRLRAVLRLK